MSATRRCAYFENRPASRFLSGILFLSADNRLRNLRYRLGEQLKGLTALISIPHSTGMKIDVRSASGTQLNHGSS